MEKYKLFDNEELSRYEYHIDEYRPQIEYNKKGNVIALTHTRVPADLQGEGIGTMLVKDVLDDISDKNLELVPLCGFVISYMKDHPEYNRLIKEDIYVG